MRHLSEVKRTHRPIASDPADTPTVSRPTVLNLRTR